MTPDFASSSPMLMRESTTTPNDWRMMFFNTSSATSTRRRPRYHSMILSVLAVVMLYHGLFQQQFTLVHPPSSSIATHLTPPCRIIIDHRGTFSHSEILESLLADFPIDLPSQCQNRVLVDIYLNVPLPCRVCSRISEFISYAETYMRDKTYIGYNGQERTLGKVERRLWYTLHDDSIIANIYTSAYCRFPFTHEIQNPKTYAVFHERCDIVRESPHAYWPNPMHPRFFFPNRLPQFPQQHKVLSKPYNFCVIGGTQRRSYHLLEYYYQMAGADDRFTVVLLGRGKTPPEIQSHKHSQLRINSYIEYQETIASTCDVILGLVDRAEHADYFDTDQSKQKLSGSIPQASAYQIPMVLHEDLYEIYRDYLPATVMTHGEDPASFALAVERMCEFLDEQLL